MITLSDSVSSSPSQPSMNTMNFDIEPDDEWKKILKNRIQIDMQSMAQDARERSLAELRSSTPGPEDRRRVEDDYRARMATIKETATEQYNIELEKERNKRRWIAGEPMNPAWSKYLEEEQQHVFDSYKQSRDQPVSPTHLQATFRSLSRATMRSSSPSPFAANFSELDIEPDVEWKQQLRARIQLGFQPKIQHAKDKRLLEMKNGTVAAEERKRIEEDYAASMANVKALANDEYTFEVEKERNKRRERFLRNRDAYNHSDDIAFSSKPHPPDDESLLKPPTRNTARRESTASAAARDSDLEPDDIWKEKLRLRIQVDLKDKVRVINDHHFAELRKVADEFARLEQEHREAIEHIQQLSHSRFESELAKERLRRRGFNETTEAPKDKEAEGDSGESEEDEEEEEEENEPDDKIFDDDIEGPQETIQQKQERLHRVLDESDRREAEIRMREQDVYRREIEARKKAAEAKLVPPDDDEIDAIKKRIKQEKMAEEHVQWKEDIEGKGDDSELPPVPPPEGGEIKPATSASDYAASDIVERARRKQQEIEDQFREYESNDVISDSLFDDPDPKWIEEQSFIWQQLQYQQQADMIQRRRQERKRQDSMGSSADGGSYGSPSSSPSTSKMHMPPPPPVQIPIIPQMPPVNRSHVPVTPWAPVSSLSLANAAASKAAAAAAAVAPPSPIPRKPSLLELMTGNIPPGSLSYDHPGPSPSPRNIPVNVAPNNLYERVQMVKTRSSGGHNSAA